MATATVTTTGTSSSSVSSFPYIETVYDDYDYNDDSSYEEYVIDEETVIEEEEIVLVDGNEMTTATAAAAAAAPTRTEKEEEKKADSNEFAAATTAMSTAVKTPDSLQQQRLSPSRGKGGVEDDSTVSPPPLPATSRSVVSDLKVDVDSLKPTPPSSSTVKDAPTTTLKVAPAPSAPPPPPPSTIDPSSSPSSSVNFTVPLTPSKQRAKAASSAGLSELSKQLRVLHAKNESQAQEISRLERQLRILADLQGVSVNDLRKALEDACASEAFGELQNRVQKLKYELEAATLAKQAEYRKDTTAPHIANLELRVGELEEVEERQQREIQHLYEQLRQERSKSTRLESENAHLKKELEDMMNRYKQEHARAAKLEAAFQDQIRQFQEDQAKKMQEQLQLARQRLEEQQKKNQQMQRQAQQSSLSSSSPSVDKSTTSGTNTTNPASVVGTYSPEMVAEYERMMKSLRDKDDELRIAQARLNAEEIKWVQKLRDVQDDARKTQMDLQCEYDKLLVTLKELEDADGQSGLRLAQYKARFAVQDERIDDLEQQLDSLYVAFTLLKEEFDSENRRHATMQSNLNDADAEVARQANVLEKQKSQRGGLGLDVGRSTSNRNNDYVRGDQSFSSVPRVVSTPTTQVTTPSRSIGMDSTSFVGGPTTDNTYNPSTPTPTYATAQPYTPTTTTPDRTSSSTNTWGLLFPEESEVGSGGHGLWLIHGPLIVESKGMLRKWKTKASKIYPRGDHYQWEIGSKQSWPLQFGISKVEYNPNYSLSFVVYLNPHDTMAPVIRAATSNERDYHRWMAALYKVTSGEEYNPDSNMVSPSTRSGTAAASTTAVASNTSPRNGFLRSSSSRLNRPQSLRANGKQSSTGSFRSRSSMSGLSATPSMDDQEAADLERALQLSKHQM